MLVESHPMEPELQQESSASSAGFIPVIDIDMPRLKRVSQTEMMKIVAESIRTPPSTSVSNSFSTTQTIFENVNVGDKTKKSKTQRKKPKKDSESLTETAYDQARNCPSPYKTTKSRKTKKENSSSKSQSKPKKKTLKDTSSKPSSEETHSQPETPPDAIKIPQAVRMASNCSTYNQFHSSNNNTQYNYQYFSPIPSNYMHHTSSNTYLNRPYGTASLSTPSLDHHPSQSLPMKGNQNSVNEMTEQTRHSHSMFPAQVHNTLYDQQPQRFYPGFHTQPSFYSYQQPDQIQKLHTIGLPSVRPSDGRYNLSWAQYMQNRYNREPFYSGKQYQHGTWPNIGLNVNPASMNSNGKFQTLNHQHLHQNGSSSNFQSGVYSRETSSNQQLLYQNPQSLYRDRFTFPQVGSGRQVQQAAISGWDANLSYPSPINEMSRSYSDNSGSLQNTESIGVRSQANSGSTYAVPVNADYIDPNNRSSQNLENICPSVGLPQNSKTIGKNVELPQNSGIYGPRRGLPQNFSDISPNIESHQTSGNVHSRVRLPPDLGNIHPNIEWARNSGNIRPNVGSPCDSGNVDPSVDLPHNKVNIGARVGLPHNSGNISSSVPLQPNTGVIGPSTELTKDPRNLCHKSQGVPNLSQQHRMFKENCSDFIQLPITQNTNSSRYNQSRYSNSSNVQKSLQSDGTHKSFLHNLSTVANSSCETSTITDKPRNSQETGRIFETPLLSNHKNIVENHSTRDKPPTVNLEISMTNNQTIGDIQSSSRVSLSSSDIGTNLQTSPASNQLLRTPASENSQEIFGYFEPNTKEFIYDAIIASPAAPKSPPVHDFKNTSPAKLFPTPRSSLDDDSEVAENYDTPSKPGTRDPQCGVEFEIDINEISSILSQSVYNENVTDCMITDSTVILSPESISDFTI